MPVFYNGITLLHRVGLMIVMVQFHLSLGALFPVYISNSLWAIVLPKSFSESVPRRQGGSYTHFTVSSGPHELHMNWAKHTSQWRSPVWYWYWVCALNAIRSRFYRIALYDSSSAWGQKDLTVHANDYHQTLLLLNRRVFMQLCLFDIKAV